MLTFHSRIAGILLAVLFTQGASGQIIHTDDFSSYPSGGEASPHWSSSGGFWYVADGMICENSGAYDNGLFLGEYLDVSYEATVRFMMVEGHRGPGFLFNSSSRSSAQYAQMVRLSNDRVIYGYREEDGYHGTGSVSLPESVGRETWNTMTLTVDPEIGTFHFSINGEPLARDLPLRYRTGYFGLQNSGGISCFDQVSVEKLRDRAFPLPLSWPAAIAAGPEGSVWVSSAASGAVRLLSTEGEILFELNPEATRAFEAPLALTSLSNGDVVVLDTGAKRLHRYASDGKWVATGGAGLQDPMDVASWDDGTIAVSDPVTGAVIFFDRNLGRLGSLSMESRYEPGVIAAAPGRLAFADLDAGSIHVFTGSGSDWSLEATFYMPPGPVRGLALDGDDLFATVGGSIRRFDTSGEEHGVLNLDMMRHVLPQRIVVSGDQVCIADFIGNRVLVADRALQAPGLQHTFENGRLQVAWQSGVEAPGRIQVTADGEPWQEGTGEAPSRSHQFGFGGVEPSTLYRVKYGPLMRAIPEDTGLSDDVVLMSPPRDGETHFVEIKGAVILFSNVIDTTRVTDDWPSEQPPLSRDETDRILAQVEDGRRFFWMNSGMRLHLDLDYFIVDEPKEWRDVFEETPVYPPITEVLEGVLEQQGADVSDYESIFYLVVVRDFDPETGEWDIRGPGGAFTSGIGWNGRYGRSWWEVTREHHPSGNNWLVVHEFHHQLDELFMRSGYPEYWFNHFSPHIGTAGNFGEHFDGNAHILREWPPDQYFALDYGRLAFAEDTNMNGIPDDAPHLPMDDVRLGRQVGTATSGDGHSDRERLFLSNWTVEGVGETYAEPAHFPDFNGLDAVDVAASDTHPLYPFPTVVESGRFVTIGETDDDRAPHRVHASWSADSLFLRFESPPGRPIKVLIDANADGWFVGRDNFQFRLDVDSLEGTVDVFHAGRADRWPRMDADLASSVEYAFYALPDGAGYQLSVARNPDLGLVLKEGQKLGLNFGVAIPEYGPKRRRYLTIHEPNRFIHFTLSGAGRAASRAADGAD